VIRREWVDDRLVAETWRGYQEIRSESREVIEVSANRSRDEKDANNRAF
jgi:hypothetical protein